MFQELGVQAMVNISSHLIFIIITWQLLRAVRIEEIFKKNRIVEARILIAFITIAISSTVSHFFIDLIHWMQQILYIFKKERSAETNPLLIFFMEKNH